MSNSRIISHDKYGSKIYSDSIVYDELSDEYFIPVESRGIWGDYFLGDFYPLNTNKIKVIKRHAKMADLRKMMQNNKSDSTYNVKGDVNE